MGVGFSWSGNSADYSMGDWDAARDNFAAIQVFLERFPAVAANDFYITAESYGGHYMPTLAKYIMDHQPNSINFKGFAVGNPFTSKVSAAFFSICEIRIEPPQVCGREDSRDHVQAHLLLQRIAICYAIACS